MLPVLTVNRSFMYDFMDAEPPCGALGLVEETGGKAALWRCTSMRTSPRR